MKVELIRIGNSQGIRIPKPVIEQCGLVGELDMQVGADGLIIRPARTPRKGWAEAFTEMAARGDDEALLPEDLATDWDDSDWEW